MWERKSNQIMTAAGLEEKCHARATRLTRMPPVPVVRVVFCFGYYKNAWLLSFKDNNDPP